MQLNVVYVRKIMTDVNIAVNLLVDAEDDRFDTAIIVSADSDLSPPIDTVLKRKPTKRIVVAFPPKRFSNALKSTASAWTSIDPKTLKKQSISSMCVNCRWIFLASASKVDLKIHIVVLAD